MFNTTIAHGEKTVRAIIKFNAALVNKDIINYFSPKLNKAGTIATVAISYSTAPSEYDGAPAMDILKNVEAVKKQIKKLI